MVNEMFWLHGGICQSYHTLCANCAAAEYQRVAGNCDLGSNGGSIKGEERKGDYWRLIPGLLWEDKWIGTLVEDGSRWFNWC